MILASVHGAPHLGTERAGQRAVRIQMLLTLPALVVELHLPPMQMSPSLLVKLQLITAG